MIGVGRFTYSGEPKVRNAFDDFMSLIIDRFTNFVILLFNFQDFITLFVIDLKKKTAKIVSNKSSYPSCCRCKVELSNLTSELRALK